MRPQWQSELLATHRTAESALSSTFMIKNVFKITRIADGVSFNGPEQQDELLRIGYIQGRFEFDDGRLISALHAWLAELKIRFS
jgi:hypothetical protein